MGLSHTPDPAVFRRRRLLALTILLVLVAGVALGAQAVMRAIDAADDVIPRTVSTAPITPVDVDDEPTGPPTEEELANPVDCRPAAVDLAIGMGTTAVAGATTAMPVTVTNAGQVPCLLDIGGAQIELTIYSGEDLVWTSQHCSTLGDRRVLLDIGAADTVAFRWTGTRSAPSCPGDQPVAGAGTYRAVVVLETAGESPEQVATVEQVFTVT